MFSPNAGKYGPEKTPYLNTFHALVFTLTCLYLFTLTYPYNMGNIEMTMKFSISFGGDYLETATGGVL